MDRSFDHVDAMRKRVEDGGVLTREESLHLLEWIYPQWRRDVRAMDERRREMRALDPKNPDLDSIRIDGVIRGMDWRALGRHAQERAERAWERADKAKG